MMKQIHGYDKQKPSCKKRHCSQKPQPLLWCCCVKTLQIYVCLGCMNSRNMTMIARKFLTRQNNTGRKGVQQLHYVCEMRAAYLACKIGHTSNHSIAYFTFYCKLWWRVLFTSWFWTLVKTAARDIPATTTNINCFFRKIAMRVLLLPKFISFYANKNILERFRKLVSF